MLKTIRGLFLALLLGAPVLSVAQTPLDEYSDVLRKTMGLQALNSALERQIQNQELELSQLQTSITQVPDFVDQVPGLLQRMVTGLQMFVNLDVPFLPEERQKRIDDLLLLLEDDEVDYSEKFRRVFEAWSVESGYGSDVAAYPGEQDIDGVVRNVDFLRLGRLGLYYQTPDLEVQAAYDPRKKAWVQLGTEYRNSLRQALRMASNQVAPDITLLPIVPPVDE